MPKTLALRSVLNFCKLMVWLILDSLVQALPSVITELEEPRSRRELIKFLQCPVGSRLIRCTLWGTWQGLPLIIARSSSLLINLSPDTLHLDLKIFGWPIPELGRLWGRCRGSLFMVMLNTGFLKDWNFSGGVWWGGTELRWAIYFLDWRLLRKIFICFRRGRKGMVACRIMTCSPYGPSFLSITPFILSRRFFGDRSPGFNGSGKAIGTSSSFTKPLWFVDTKTESGPCALLRNAGLMRMLISLKRVIFSSNPDGQCPPYS